MKIISMRSFGFEAALASDRDRRRYGAYGCGPFR